MCVASRRVTSVILAMPGCGRVHHLGDAVAADDGEPRAVDDLVERHLGGASGGDDLRGRHVHRAGGVDDDDLGRLALAGLAGVAGAGAGDRHDGVHIGGPLGQVLVLEDLCLELSHVMSSLVPSVAMGHSGQGRP